MTYNQNNYTRCEKCKHIDRENKKCKITNDNWLVSDRAGTCHQFKGVESMNKNSWIRINKEYAEHLGLDHRAEYRVLNETEHEFKIFDEKYLWVKKVWTEILDKDEIKNSLQLAKEFDEQMERVGELASKCGVSREELFNNPIKPNHYQAGEFDVIAFCFKHNLDFASGNVVKYVTRAGKKDKDKELEDLLKAKEYLERKIERLEKEDN